VLFYLYFLVNSLKKKFESPYVEIPHDVHRRTSLINTIIQMYPTQS